MCTSKPQPGRCYFSWMIRKKGKHAKPTDLIQHNASRRESQVTEPSPWVLLLLFCPSFLFSAPASFQRQTTQIRETTNIGQASNKSSFTYLEANVTAHTRYNTGNFTVNGGFSRIRAKLTYLMWLLSSVLTITLKPDKSFVQYCKWWYIA